MNPSLSILLWAVLLSRPFAHLAAADISIENPAQLKALSSAKPGDTVTLRNGTWENAAINIGAGGSLERSVTIRAETPGKVILTGHSTLALKAPYVIVDGLLFTKGYINSGSVIRFESHHGTVRNSAVIDFNPPKFETNYYWAHFAGDYNLLDHCYFKGKNHMKPVIGNELTNNRYNTISHCYFKDIPYAHNNGREILRIYGPGKWDEHPDDGAFFTIEANLFDHADGEGSEIISLKSNHNQVLRNTIIATRGGINIRRAESNVVRDNIILGQGVEGSQSLRMSGRHHVVQGNFISGCDVGIRITTGEFTASDLSGGYKPYLTEQAKDNPSLLSVPTYPQVKDLTLADNTVVGTKGADLEIGYAYKAHWPGTQQVLVPEECLIKGNKFIRPKSGISVIGAIPDATPPLDRLKFKPNVYSENLLVGGSNDFPPSAAGFHTRPYSEDESDLQTKLKIKPLTPADVGPDWLHTP